jgi:hypothetical protein
MPLEEELKYFDSIRADLLAKNHEGKFALVKGANLIGTYDKPEDAYAEGVKRFGAESFLVKEVLQTDRTESVPNLFVGSLNARL